MEGNYGLLFASFDLSDVRVDLPREIHSLRELESILVILLHLQ